MEFKKVFRGYDPNQVDKYINETAERESSTRKAQRERIEELSEENYNLRERIVELQRRQNDVAEALVVAERVASDIEQHAKDYADRALVEAKKFYATWQAYSKTIVASFTDDELAAFNILEKKIGDVIANYERKLKNGESAEVNKAQTGRKMSPAEFVKKMEQAADELNVKSSKAEKEVAATSDKSANPITRVEQAAGQSIDLRELIHPKQSLEELCADLGLIDGEDASEIPTGQGADDEE